MAALRQQGKRAGAPAGDPRGGCAHYLPVGDAIRGWELYVTSVGAQDYARNEGYPRPGHPSLYDFDWRKGRTLPDYALVLVTRGRGEYEFRNLPKRECGPGDVLLMAPGQWHRYRPLPATGWTERWLCLGGEYLQRLRRRGLVFTRPCVALGERLGAARAAWEALLAKARAEPEQNGPELTALALRVLALVAAATEAELARTVSERVPAADPDVAKALEFVRNNSHRPIRIADVARAVGLHARTLERRFAAQHPRGVRAEIECSRYARAKRLLKDTRMPIKEIAYACGFGDPRRMIEIFRRREARAPREVRAQAANATA
ncbi:helix-turn-helix domain-containing protein [Opitutus sp. ER46]|uniref:AraC family transcriptional regulator n=1 Tax=Opitutus sp. ER46 TaxID=2161864 RepID=UPI000D2FC8B8|nr:helix-turn-helix domain-containing protein [Opitutus sp. ER46]PTX95657.1 hypothetical protein DB354_09595 [Opitutus sp. ER46]